MKNICFLKLYTNALAFESATSPFSTLAEIIEDDKQYGMMVPANGKKFKFSVMDWKSKTITNKQIIKAITLAWQQTEFEIPIDCEKAKENEYADFKIFFRRTIDDPLLTKNTLMYHYYPISLKSNPNRGVCVVNTDFNWTIDGEPISMHILDPNHYPEETPIKGGTIDFDQVYTHELSHGLGLSHPPNKDKVLSPNYSIMAEFLTDEEPLETIPRLIAKYGQRNMLSKTRLKLRNWYKYRAERY